MRRRLWRGLGLTLLGLAVYLSPFLYRVYHLPQAPGELAPTGHGIWLGHRFLEASPGDLEQLASRCRRLGLTNLYLHAGPLDSEGRIPRSAPQKTLQELRTRLPEARLLAWLGGIHSRYWGGAPDTFDPARPGQLQETIAGLLANGFDGVHFDIEPVPDQDPAFLRMLEQTRQTLRGRLLSVAAPQLQPPGVPRFLPSMERLWSPEYAAEVGQRCDQIALMAYDTFQPTSSLFTRYVAYQARTLRGCLPCELLVGVPSYEDNWPFHNPRAETLAAGVLGARYSGVAQIALYAEWTTDSQEWDTWATS